MGAGRGVGLEILVSLGAARLTGFDLDPKMLRLAEAWIAPHGDRARLFVDDAGAVDAPNRPYKAVVEYGILHHVPDWPQAMRKIARMLKPGGALYFEDVRNDFTSLWPARFVQPPQGKQFLRDEFHAGLLAAGLGIEVWRPFIEGGVPGRAVKPG